MSSLLGRRTRSHEGYGEEPFVFLRTTPCKVDLRDAFLAVRFAGCCLCRNRYRPPVQFEPGGSLTDSRGLVLEVETL
jgi:hypothetical protein